LFEHKTQFSDLAKHHEAIKGMMHLGLSQRSLLFPDTTVC